MLVGAEQVLHIGDFLPCSDNLGKRKRHWGAVARAKAIDRAMVKVYAGQLGISQARGPRMVRIEFTYLKRGRPPDSRNLLKSLLDAMVQARLLVDDSDRYCVLSGVNGKRTGRLSTTVYLRDLAEE